MNKNDLIDALTPRLGDRAAAALAVESLVDVVLRQVAAGGTVGITGFGTFEPVDRAPRTGRNPHTGQAVPIPATRTPRFRPGTYFKDVVADPERLPASGLAGARVGSAEDEASGSWRGSGSAGATGSSSAGEGTTGRGAPPTIRRAAGASRGTGGGPARQGRKSASEAGRRRSGTPATVRAERPEPQPDGTAEPRGERKGRRRMTMGGEQITQEMISAKKAQLARAKDDHVADGADGRAAAGRKARAAKAAGKKDKNDKKDKKKGKGKKGKKA